MSRSFVADDLSESALPPTIAKRRIHFASARRLVGLTVRRREQAGGHHAADYDRDGWPDIVKTNFSDDTNNLYHNDRNGEFTDVAGTAGIGAISIPFLGFGAKFLDFDNDGWPDLFIANGHVDPQVNGQSFGVGYAERPFLFHNLKNGKFEEWDRAGLLCGNMLRAAQVADFESQRVICRLSDCLRSPAKRCAPELALVV
jgi:hypothetical protein